jgi:hypothetical protein
MRYNNAEHTGSFDISGSWIIPNRTTGSIDNPTSGSLIFDTDTDRLLIYLGEWKLVASTIV